MPKTPKNGSRTAQKSWLPEFCFPTPEPVSDGVAQAAEQTAEAVRGIRILMGLIHQVFVVLAVVVRFFYPLENKKKVESAV